MRSLTVAVAYSSTSGFSMPAQFWRSIEAFGRYSCVSRIVILHHGPAPQISALEGAYEPVQCIQMNSWFSGIGMSLLLEASDTDGLLLLLPGDEIDIGQPGLERFLTVAKDTSAGLVYSDFRETRSGQTLEHPTTDYQLGSIRDNFGFGALVFISKEATQQTLKTHGPIEPGLRWAGLYDLRLKLSLDFPIVRIPESLYTVRCEAEDVPTSASDGAERIFHYVDPKNQDVQLEMERVATAHLRRLGAFLKPVFSSPPAPESDFPVTASVIIPVRNRAKTITGAVHSALGQSAPFPFNVIAVDNHSTDGTTEILSQLAAQQENLIHKIPQRTDLGIGGCWNEAIYAPQCGLYAVQLDSDDLYADAHTLAKVVSTFGAHPADGNHSASTTTPRYAMIIGSYTTVNFDLQAIGPGLVDHREWTRENGRNNALRINGLGAPRAFYTPVLRRFGFANVSYGEDYGVSLRISREYEIGRILEPIYLVRRWEDNTDRALPLATVNRYDAYKDWLRTVEIQARRRAAVP